MPDLTLSFSKLFSVVRSRLHYLPEHVGDGKAPYDRLACPMLANLLVAFKSEGFC
jgi:hypothetical protein